jgi:hypothetical protein
MRHIILPLSTVLLTFIIGLASATAWLYFHHQLNTRQQSANIYIQLESFRRPERLHICLTRFDINLGDSFQYVDSLIHLMPDPNGPNQNTSWQQGKLTDFFSVSGDSIKLDKDNRLNPAIYCTFDDQKRLKSFFISWRFEGKQINSVKRKILDTVIEREHLCMNGRRFEKPLDVHTDYLDYGDYWEVFAYDFRENSNWSTGYVIETKDVLYGAPNNSFNPSPR